MLENDVINLLKQLDWHCKRDEVGDQYCLLDLDDRQLCVIPTLREAKDLKTGANYKALGFMESMSSYEFIHVVNYIFNKKSDHKPMVKPWQSDFRKQKPDFTNTEVKSLIDQIIDWAREQDIDDALKNYRNKRPDRPGQKQLYHLAALALAGDISSLTSYQQSFSRGDRLNFVPMITDEVIGRAVQFAKDRYIEITKPSTNAV